MRPASVAEVHKFSHSFVFTENLGKPDVYWKKCITMNPWKSLIQ